MNKVDEYISRFPEDVAKRLLAVRELIRSNAPGAQEAMAYGVPTFKMNGSNLIHFAAFKQHIGIYPGPELIEEMASDLKRYETSKGTIKFPLSEPLPVTLLCKIVKKLVKKRATQKR